MEELDYDDDAIANFDDDRSIDSEGNMKSDSESDIRDNTDDESNSDNESPSPQTQRHIASVERFGDDRTTNIKLSQNELVSAVIFYTNEINKGAKVPNIVGDITGITDAITLAYKSVMATVRSSRLQVKSEFEKKNGVGMFLRRPVTSTTTDVWALHDLVYFSKSSADALDYDLIASDQIAMDNWYTM